MYRSTNNPNGNEVIRRKAQTVPAPHEDKEVNMQAETLSTSARVIGRLVEIMASGVTNGVTSANRRFIRLIILIIIITNLMSFTIGMLLMRTIDREISSPRVIKVVQASD